MTETFRATGPVSALEIATRTIREAILRGQFGPGDKIGQAQIAEMAGISRVPVREALRELAAQNVIGYEPRRGYHVRHLSEHQFREIYLMRDLLEDELLKQAWPYLDDALIAELRALQKAMSKAAAEVDYVSFAAAQKSFQFAIFARANLPRMADAVDVLWHAADVYRAVFLRSIDALSHVDEEHARLLSACESRDLDAALTELDTTRSLVVDRVVAVINEAPAHVISIDRPSAWPADDVSIEH